MLLIQDILVSATLLEEHFVCSLEHCKGACCWKGDFGAPLEAAEIEVIEAALPAIKPLLPPESVQRIEAEGFHKRYEEKDMTGTNLMDDGACVFMTRDENGIAGCGIEKAWENHALDFRKPISCHLYPVRVTKVPDLEFEALNYEEWDICSAACKLGQKLEVPLYKFVESAIVRKYGEAFFSELDSVAKDIESGKQQ